VAGFSKFFQRISGNVTVQEDDKEESKVIEKEVAQESKGHESKELPNEEGRKSEDENDEVQEVQKVDHKYVGLVIEKDGSKSFTKQSGTSIEIDQTLPPGMPRMVYS